MPPKPFNPPRPSSTSASAPKKGRPKSSTNKPKSTNGVKKSASASNGKGKGKERLSAASVRSLLPSLSPDTGDEDLEMDVEEQEREEEESDDPFASQPRPRTSKSNPQEDREDEHAAELDARKERIPDDLLSVILSRMFKEQGNGGTRMSKEAVKAVGKYVDTFVREGVARGAWAGEGRGDGDRGGGVLEVSDLEKLAPQLLLDF
jgi:hypothetical protein